MKTLIPPKYKNIAFLIVGLFFLALVTISNLDHRPFCGDEACYGFDAVDLLRSFQKSPSEWITKMLHVSPDKPPGIVWLGQIFVPISGYLGSIDKAFVFSTSLLISLSTLLIYISIKKIGEATNSGALGAMLFMMSSPLLLTGSFTYLTEPLQLISVTLFVLLMACSADMNQKTKIILLVGALSLALASKINTAAFCMIPTLIIAYSIIKTPSHELQITKCSMGCFLFAPFVLIFAGATVSWYYYNFHSAFDHLKYAYATAYPGGVLPAVWGVKAAFTETLFYWLLVSCSELMLPATAIVLVAFLITATITRVCKGPKNLTFLDVCFIASLIQIGVVIILFGMSSVRVTRYLTPVIPYFSVIVAWSLRWMPWKPLRIAFLTYFICIIIFEIMTMADLNLSSFQWRIPIRRIFNQQKDIQFLKEIIRDTNSAEDSKRQGCVVAIDPLFRGDWLAPAPLSYYSICDSSNKHSTTYYYAGNNFFGSSAEEAIKLMESDTIDCVVLADPYIYPPLSSYINKALKGEEIKKIIHSLQESKKYHLVGGVGGDKGILLFKKEK